MATLILSLPFQTACEGEIEADVGSRAEEADSSPKLGDNEPLTIEYIPGTKLIVQGTEG